MPTNDERAKAPAEPPINPTSGGSVLAGAGDYALINVRKQADGTIANALTLNDFQIADGAIYIGNCNLIAILLAYLELGSLTTMSITPKFSMTTDVWRAAFTSDFGSGAGAIVLIPNPCPNWMYLWTSSATTVTGSYAIIDVARGWGAARFSGDWQS